MQELQDGNGRASEEGTWLKADVLPPRRDTAGGEGWDRASHRQVLTR